MTQLNTPYPATAYLTGFLRGQGFDVRQSDPALDLILRLFSRSGLERALSVLAGGEEGGDGSPYVEHFLSEADRYLNVVDGVVRFLQGKDPSLAMRIAGRGFLPEGPSFIALDQWADLEDPELNWAFGTMGIQDRAKYLASLFLDDLAGMIRDGVDPQFSLSRYGERLAASVENFSPLVEAIEAQPTLVGIMLDELTSELLSKHTPDVVGLSVPFPGNFLGALRIAQQVRQALPNCKVLLGGGYVNTELRELNEPRLFDFVDFVTLDDGERPVLNILEFLAGKRAEDSLLRTFVRRGGAIRWISHVDERDFHHNDTGNPTYDGLQLDRYLSIVEMLNPMHRIWSDGRWNKLTLAHGCYWSRCSFCDVSLDYISRYQEADLDVLMARIRVLIEETGQTGFHFVDEAAPPKVLFALAHRLLEEGLNITWWSNIRFEKSFTPKMAELLAASGCIAVTGGLEVASNRLLKLMNKGVTVEQVARVTRAFSDAGVLVHAYLMYGFPTQDEQETIDALERVRQLIQNGCIQSAYWHRFAATVHSPVGREPEKFGVKIIPRSAAAFAKNDLNFEDPVRCDHDALGVGLKRALYNYMLGIGFDEPLQFWFEHRIPRTNLPKDYIARQIM